jgi:hypothetical protein
MARLEKRSHPSPSIEQAIGVDQGQRSGLTEGAARGAALRMTRSNPEVQLANSLSASYDVQLIVVHFVIMCYDEHDQGSAGR